VKSFLQGALNYPGFCRKRKISFSSGTISSLIAIGSIFSILDRSTAQIIPDTSLGNEASVLFPNPPLQPGLIDRIEGGAIRGSALFHSFQEFNVGQGRSVYFANPAGITNILSRVTGSNSSQILVQPTPRHPWQHLSEGAEWKFKPEKWSNYCQQHYWTERFRRRQN
jgi:hypothetical protein